MPSEDAETDMDVLMRKADTAMYTAKQSGRDQTLSSGKKE
jgi:PleD family two-component response regulator